MSDGSDDNDDTRSYTIKSSHLGNKFYFNIYNQNKKLHLLDHVMWL